MTGSKREKRIARQTAEQEAFQKKKLRQLENPNSFKRVSEAEPISTAKSVREAQRPADMVIYKFKNWTKTRTTKATVTPKMRQDRAEEIATKLNATTLWKSHSRGLSMRVIENDLNLMVEDFGKNADLNKKIRAYYRLLQDYMLRTRQTLAVHTNGHFLGVAV